MPFDELAEFRDLIGELPSTTTEFTKSPENAFAPTDECDVNAFFFQALANINIFAENELSGFLDSLIRRRFEDVFQCRLQRT
jgi:hypothetical protein